MSKVNGLVIMGFVILATLGGAVVGGLLVGAGFWAFASAPGETKAVRSPAAVTVVTCYPGLTADRVETTITRRVESWLQDLPGVSTSISKSIAGVSMVKLTLHQDTDAALTLARANALVFAGIATLPPNCPRPLVQFGEPDGTHVLGLLILRDPNRSEVQLWDVATGTLRPLLARRSDLRAPVVFGGKQRQISIFLDQTKMQARRLSLPEVVQAVEKYERALPGGAVPVGELRFLLEAQGAGGTINDLLHLPVRTGVDDTIYLSDVGIPKDSSAPQTALVRSDGRRTVCVPLFRSRTGATQKDLQQAFAEVEKQLPEGVRLSFLPCGDEGGGAGEMTVYLRAASGLRLAATEERVGKVEDFLKRAIPAEEREWILSELGVKPDPSALYTQNAGSQDATIRIRFTAKRAHPAPEYAARLRRLFREEAAFADLSARFRAGPVVFSALDQAALADLGVEVTGGTVKDRLQVTQLVRDSVQKVAGAADVERWQRTDAPTLLIAVDRKKAAQLSLSTAEVVRQTTAAIEPAPLRGSWIDATGKEYSVTIQYPGKAPQTFDDILNIALTSPNKNVPILPLKELAMLRRQQEPVEVNHVNGFPVFDVLINVEGRAVSAVADEIEKCLRAEKTPKGTVLRLRRLARNRGR